MPPYQHPMSSSSSSMYICMYDCIYTEEDRKRARKRGRGKRENTGSELTCRWVLGAFNACVCVRVCVCVRARAWVSAYTCRFGARRHP